MPLPPALQWQDPRAMPAVQPGPPPPRPQQPQQQDQGDASARAKRPRGYQVGTMGLASLRPNLCSANMMGQRTWQDGEDTRKAPRVP